MMTCDSTSNDVQSILKSLVNCQAYGGHTAIAVPTYVQVTETLTMDGRGGTAAPSYRPQ